MNCTVAQSRLSAYFDGELGALARWSTERHLRGCTPCSARLAALQALRQRLRGQLPRHAAPAALQARLRALAPDAPAAPAPRAERPRWQWLGAGALAGCAATLLALVVGNFVLGRMAAEDLVAEAVGGHVQALLAQHPIEVASSDQHTVKPWLSERLDYAPPVADLSAEGFPLVGGRVQDLQGQRVATLVYRHRLHWIDVYVRPEPVATLAAARSLRGFNLAQASSGGMDFLAVSDLNAEELGAFVQRLAHPPGESLR
jgi:anti-sigma factor RsiW